MSKLFKLKEWVTVADAARHLSIAFGEEVNESDVLRLGLDGHLKLSVNFVNSARAKCGKVIPIEDARYREFPAERVATIPGIPEEHTVNPVIVLPGLTIDDKRVLYFDANVANVEGFGDLPMVCAGRLAVAHRDRI